MAVFYGGLRRPALLYGLPTLLLLAWVVFPLARGTDTLYLRDVFATHLPLKASQAQALRSGHFPLLDPWRAQGQPLAGNPNAVPFYPDDLLYLAGPTLWALNAHFWLHLLLAVPAAYGLGRAWGLGRRGSWAAGVSWGVSGWALSQLNLYNLVATVALLPAFLAACLRAGEGGAGRWRWAAAAGLLWGLLLLAGDPMTAALALALGVTALLARGGLRNRLRASPSQSEWAPLAVALAAGTLLAAPQLVELLRVLPASFRGVYGYSRQAATAASWDPRQLAEWLLPFPFGRPDLAGEGSFWGHRFTAGSPPLFFSLYPGLLSLALAAAALTRRRERAALWSLGAAAVGLFFALGRFNPLAAWLFSLPGLRYPVKLWPAVAVGGALLAGLGFEAAFVRGGRSARRAFWIALAALALLLALAWAGLTLAPAGAEAVLRGWLPPGRPAGFAAAEVARLAESLRGSLPLAAVLALAAAAAHLRPAAWGGVLLALHAGGQLVLLKPLYATDAALPYRLPPPVLALVPEGSLVVQGEAGGLFGPGALTRGSPPDGRSLWLSRQAHYRLYPAAGPLVGRRFALNSSPEGLDSFYSRVAESAVRDAGDAEGVRLLAAFGVDRLLLSRPLEPEAESAAEPLGALPGPGGLLYVYRLPGALPAAALVGKVHSAPDLDAAFRHLTRPGFDPRREGVILGSGPARDAPPGEVRVLASRPEAVELEVSSAAGGLLVLPRAHLPVWRAALDGRTVATAVANFHLLGVEVPPGEHRLRLWVERRTLALGLTLSALGLLALAALCLVSGRRPLGHHSLG